MNFNHYFIHLFKTSFFLIASLIFLSSFSLPPFHFSFIFYSFIQQSWFHFENVINTTGRERERLLDYVGKTKRDERIEEKEREREEKSVREEYVGIHLHQTNDYFILFLLTKEKIVISLLYCFYIYVMKSFVIIPQEYI